MFLTILAFMFNSLRHYLLCNKNSNEGEETDDDDDDESSDDENQRGSANFEQRETNEIKPISGHGILMNKIRSISTYLWTFSLIVLLLLCLIYVFIRGSWNTHENWQTGNI